MLILGFAEQDGLSAAALVKDGALIAVDDTGAQNCLVRAGISLVDIDSIVYFEKPLLKLERVFETYLSYAPKGLSFFKQSIAHVMRETFYKKKNLVQDLCALSGLDKKILVPKLLFSDRQLSLAAAAFYPSPYEESVILTLDGGGEWASSSIAIGKGSALEIEREILYPHSLSLFQNMFARYLGVDVDTLLSLAREGDPTYIHTITRHFIDIKNDGSFSIHQGYCHYPIGDWDTSEAFHELMAGGPRKPDEPLELRHRNIAASVQAIITLITVKMAHALSREYRGISALCLAGDMIDDAVYQSIVREGCFKQVHRPAHTGILGAAIGAAYAAHHIHHEKPRDVMFLQESRALRN